MKKFGHYEVTAELGRGGMGVVYKGWEPSLNRQVAIKCLGEHLLNDKDLVERFTREAKATAALNNPNVIQIYFIGEEQGQPFFAMEYIEGQSLDDILKGGNAITVKHAKNLLKQACLGLAAAHEKDLVHRDIKPANLMLTKDGILKVVDFGIARTREYGDKLTNTGEFVGTPGYLSPEVCIGKEVDLRSDIFSLGIVFYEMLAGKVPFENDSPLGLMLEVVQSDIPDIRALNNKVDRKTSFILNKMIAKSPDDRYQSCDEIIRDLGNTIENETLVSIKKSTIAIKAQPVKKPVSEQITLPGSEALTAQNLTLQPQAKKSGGKLKFLVAASLFSLMAVAGVGYYGGFFPEISGSTDKVALVDENSLSNSVATVENESTQAIDEPVQQETTPQDSQSEENTQNDTDNLMASSTPLFAEDKDEKQSEVDTTKIDFPNVQDETQEKVQELAQAQIIDATIQQVPQLTDAQAINESAQTLASASDVNTQPTVIAQEDRLTMPEQAELNQVAMNTPVQQNGLDSQAQIPQLAVETAQSMATQATQAVQTTQQVQVQVTAQQVPQQVQQVAYQQVQQVVKKSVVKKVVKKRAVVLNKGVVVIAFGDPAIANPVEKILEGQLKSKGIKVMNEQFIPGMRQLVENGLDLAELKALIQKNGGQAMVIANVNYVGSQQLNYAGRSSELINAQLDIDTYDVKTGDSIGNGFGSKLSYTTLNATDEATDAVMPYAGELTQSLKGKI